MSTNGGDVEAIHKANPVIWMDGNFVPFHEATIHPLSNTVQYGMGVFEGIRCYPVKGQGAIFRLQEHTKRLFESAHIIGIEMPFSQDVVSKAICETARRNQITGGYLRPMVYLGWESLGLHAQNLSSHVMIAGWTMGGYLTTADADSGLRLRTSSIARNPPQSSVPKAKVCGQYIYSAMAFKDAKNAGCDDALMLDANGCIAEASTSNVFLVKDGVLHTPSEVSILLGITRDTILEIANDLGIEARVRNLTREDAYTADEMFLVGTAAEIKAVAELDNRKIGAGVRGAVTKRIQSEFQKIVLGENPKYADWLTAL